MTAVEADGASGFSARAVLALVAVGLISLASLAVLSTFAPELRGAADAGAHALSASAVGFKGAVAAQRALGVPVVISRARPSPRQAASQFIVLTPGLGTSAKALAAYPPAERTLIVLPKWETAPQPGRPGFVQKAGLGENPVHATALLKPWSAKTDIAHRSGVSRPVLRGVGGPFAAGTVLSLGPVDSLQTLEGPGWRPALVDEEGRTVLAYAAARPGLLVLADPDLLNTQGLADPKTAAAGVALLELMHGPERGTVFDVTLNGFARQRGVGRLLLSPPWLAATLCGVAAGLLMGWQALVRFGPAQARGRAIALGTSALVENSAGLVRMARKEHELASAYLALNAELVGRAAGEGHGGSGDDWLKRLAARRGAAEPEALQIEAGGVKTRDAALAFAKRIHRWRVEMTLERR